VHIPKGPKEISRNYGYFIQVFQFAELHHKAQVVNEGNVQIVRKFLTDRIQGQRSWIVSSDYLKRVQVVNDTFAFSIRLLAGSQESFFN
jgi:hypothetical protein